MGKIVSVHSFRGGTGKSNLSANLAAQVALAGKRVGVIDTDIQSPGIHVLFGLRPDTMGRTLNEFLRGECTIEETAVNVADSVVDAPGLDRLAGRTLFLVPSSIKSQDIATIVRDGYDINRLNTGLQTMLRSLRLDYLFIDTHPGLNEETLLSVATSDMLIIILRPDQQDFQGTAVTVDVARRLNVPNVHLVVNKALSRYDFGRIRDRVQQTYNAPVVAVLPLTEDMADMGSAGLYSLCYPRLPWSEGIRAMARRVLDTA